MKDTSCVISQWCLNYDFCDSIDCHEFSLPVHHVYHKNQNFRHSDILLIQLNKRKAFCNHYCPVKNQL